MPQPDAPAPTTSGGPAAASPDAERLVTEAVVRDVRVDKQHRVVRGIALSGLVSRNGYRYRPDALRRAAPLYEGRPVFLDHARDPARPQDRSTRDLVGTLSNVRFDAEADVLRGNVRVLDTESGRTFLALCEGWDGAAAPDDGSHGIGMSHVVLARRSPDGGEVTAIERVVSVDAVVFPATTRSLSEQDGAPAPLNSDADERPLDRTESLLAVVERMSRQRLRLREELADARRELDAAHLRERRDGLLQEAGLPADALTGPFRRAVHEAATDDAAAALIQDRHTVLNVRGQPTRTSRPQSSVPADSGPSDRQFVTAVRGRR